MVVKATVTTCSSRILTGTSRSFSPDNRYLKQTYSDPYCYGDTLSAVGTSGRLQTKSNIDTGDF